MHALISKHVLDVSRYPHIFINTRIFSTQVACYEQGISATNFHQGYREICDVSRREHLFIKRESFYKQGTLFYKEHKSGNMGGHEQI
jgi:hypothetical protein